MGDDGAGIRAIELLAGRVLPSNVKLELAGTPGWGLPAWLEGWDSVIIVDAANMDQTPGTWRRFDAEEVSLLTEGDILSLHQSDLAGGLALAEALDLLPHKVVFYGIEPDCADPGQDLSLAVSKSLPNMVDNILDELGKMGK